MTSSVSLTGMRTLMWYFNKRMRKGIQGLWIDEQSVKMVKGLISENHKVILMPLYKSFADFFIHQFVNYTQHIQTSFTFGNFEDTPRIALMDRWLRSCGYIFSRRKNGQSLQSNYINSELLN